MVPVDVSITKVSRLTQAKVFIIGPWLNRICFLGFFFGVDEGFMVYMNTDIEMSDKTVVDVVLKI